MRVLTAIRQLRSTPFDTTTEGGRSAERYRLAAISIAASVMSRGIGMVAMVLAVSLTVPYLGVERFGVWMTIASFSTMLSFLDLGTGNALTNHVAKCAAEGRTDRVRQAISGGLGFLALIGVIIAVVLCVTAATLPWERLLKSSEASVAKEARQAAMVFGVLFGLSIVSSGIHRVFSGLQRAFEAHAITATASAISIIGLLAATSRQAGVPVLLLVTLGSQIGTTGLLLWSLRSKGLLAWRGLGAATRAEAGKLVRVSLMFLILQIGVMIGWGADSLIVSSTLGVAQVAIYSVTQRLFLFVSLPLGMANAPLWAAYADAHARGDATFIRKTLRTTLIATFTLSVFGVGLVALVAQPVIGYWTHGKVEVHLAFVLLFGAWTILEASGNSFAMFLNGCAIIRPQVVCTLVFCVLVTPLKFLLVADYGLNGILFATVAGYIVAVPLLYLTLFRNTVADALRPSVA